MRIHHPCLYQVSFEDQREKRREGLASLALRSLKLSLGRFSKSHVRFARNHTQALCDYPHFTVLFHPAVEEIDKTLHLELLYQYQCILSIWDYLGPKASWCLRKGAI